MPAGTRLGAEIDALLSGAMTEGQMLDHYLAQAADGEEREARRAYAAAVAERAIAERR